MSDWSLPPPTPSDLGDHDVVRDGSHLEGRRIALLVTGSIAAMKIPFVARALRRQGADVVAFTSQEALRYVTVEALAWSTVNPVVERLTAAAEHLSDQAPFDAYLLAPATYNSINKVAAGIADGVVTSAMASALGRLEHGRTAVLIAPTMHGSLNNRILAASLARLHDLGVHVVAPRDAYGKYNLPDEGALVAEVSRAVSRSRLRGRRILVTGGPTPVPLDPDQRIVGRSRGRLGIAIALELHHRGADVTLVHGDGALAAPSLLPHRVAPTYDDYRSLVAAELAAGYEAAVFSARVAELRPREVAAGSLAGDAVDLKLVPTVKVIDEARQAHPDLYVVAFKYADGPSPSPSELELVETARARLDRYPCVVASPGEAEVPGDERAHLVTRAAAPLSLQGQPAIAAAIADHLEQALPDR